MFIYLYIVYFIFYYYHLKMKKSKTSDMLPHQIDAIKKVEYLINKND